MASKLTPRRRRLSNKARQELYDRCCGDGDHPICNICDLPVQPGQDWDVSHDPDGAPHALGGTDIGVAHSRCNRLHGAQVVRPMVAKCDRIRQKYTGSFRPRYPMRGGRFDNVSKSMKGGVKVRKTLAQKHAETMAKRQVRP